MKNIFAVRTLAISLVVGLSACSKTIYIAPQKVDCLGMADQKCFLIRYKPGDNWIMNSGSIAGFDYEEGFEYKVKVVREKVPGPVQGVGAINYRVVKVLSKEQALESAVRLTSQNWRLTSIEDENGVEKPVNTRNINLHFDTEENKVNGNAGCNRFFGGFEIKDDNIRFLEIGSTRMSCPDAAVNRTEAIYLGTLRQVIRYQFVDEKLRLIGENDIALIFEPEK